MQRTNQARAIKTFKIFKILVIFEILYTFLDINLDISSGVHSDVCSEIFKIFKIFKEMIFEVSSGVSPGFFNRYKIYCVQRTKQARAIKTFKAFEMYERHIDTNNTQRDLSDIRVFNRS